LSLASRYEDGKSDLIAVMNSSFELFKGSDIPPVHENDATFLQGEIFLEDALPWPLVVCLKGDEHIAQGRGFKVQSDRSLQNEFGSEDINSESHGSKRISLLRFQS
jgi:hypothetical protein